VYDEGDDYQNIAASRHEPPQYTHSQPPQTDSVKPYPQNGNASTKSLTKDVQQPPSVRQTDTVVVRALYDYEAQESDELSFKAGGILSLLLSLVSVWQWRPV